MKALRCRLGFHAWPDVRHNVGVECARGCGYVFPPPTRGVAVMPAFVSADIKPPDMPQGIPPAPAHQLMIDQARLARAEADQLELENEERRRRLA